MAECPSAWAYVMAAVVLVTYFILSGVLLLGLLKLLLVLWRPVVTTPPDHQAGDEP